jgi:hypothetical protein
MKLRYKLVQIASREPYDYHVLQWYMWLLEHGNVLVTCARATGLIIR